MSESILNDSGFAAGAAVEPKIKSNGHGPILTSDDLATSQSDFQANLQTVGYTQLIQQTETSRLSDIASISSRIVGNERTCG